MVETEVNSAQKSVEVQSEAGVGQETADRGLEEEGYTVGGEVSVDEDSNKQGK